MDAFSEILSGVKLNGALFFSAEFSAPWGFLTPPPSVIADEFAPQGMEHLVLYHFVVDGGASVQLVGGTSRGVAEIAGDIGYESESAFNRAFKREFGQPPGRYRSDHRSSPGTNGKNDI